MNLLPSDHFFRDLYNYSACSFTSKIENYERNSVNGDIQRGLNDRKFKNFEKLFLTSISKRTLLLIRPDLVIQVNMYDGGACVIRWDTATFMGSNVCQVDEIMILDKYVGE